MAEKIAGAALAGSVWTPDMAQYHDMSADQPKRHERVSSIMKDLAERGKKQASNFDNITPVNLDAKPKVDYNPYKKQDLEKAKKRQTEAEVQQQQEQQVQELASDLPTTTLMERGLKIGQKAEKSDHVPSREDVVSSVAPERSKDGSDLREIAKKLNKPSHHNMSREDRIAAAEAKLGNRLEAIKAYAEKGDGE